MDLANYEGYSKHAKNMSKRVLMRKSHPELTAIDNKVIDTIIELQKKKGNIKLLDAGCGTGERLSFILKRGKIETKKITAIGVDFCDPLIKEAKQKKNEGNLLYKEAIAKDLLEFDYPEKFDLIICLFSVLNNVGKDYKKVIVKFSDLLKEEGILIFDFINPKAGKHLFSKDYPELVKRYGQLDSNEHYYMRTFDESWGKAYLFELNELIENKDISQKIAGTSLIIGKIFDINNYKTKKGKFSVTREYLLVDGVHNPDLTKYKGTWENSILVICKKV